MISYLPTNTFFSMWTKYYNEATRRIVTIIYGNIPVVFSLSCPERTHKNRRSMTFSASLLSDCVTTILASLQLVETNKTHNAKLATPKREIR